MLLKLIPENDMEKQKIKKIEHYGVKEFFIFGNKRDEDGSLLDFQEWNGSFRYLIGSLDYFRDVINDERRNKEGKNQPNRPIMQQMGGKNIQNNPNFIKLAQAQEEFNKEDNNKEIVLQMPKKNEEEDDEEKEVEEAENVEKMGQDSKVISFQVPKEDDVKE